MRKTRKQPPKRSKVAGDRRPNAGGKWKDQRLGTRAFTTWISEPRITPQTAYRRKG